MRVTARELHQPIRSLKERLVAHDLLAPDGGQLLDEVVAGLMTCIPKKVRASNPWSYQTRAGTALTFRECSYNGYRYQVDIQFSIRGHGSDSAAPLTWQAVVIRVWSLDANLCARDDWDSKRIVDVFRSGGAGKRRVMVRHHFDLANQGQEGPRYHVQIGGGADDDEYCWHPRQMALPRLLHLPVDLILACELVVANFFPDEYKTLRDEPEWEALVRRSEDYFVRPSVTKWLGGIDRDDRPSLLHAAWNV